MMIDVRAEHKRLVSSQLQLAKDRISKVIWIPERLNTEQAKLILGTYGAAIRPNFIQWMTLAHTTVLSSRARKLLRQNLDDEIREDHPEMLDDFLSQCGVVPRYDYYRKASEPVLEMWGLFYKCNGLTNIAVAATLESTSQIFIPYLERIGQRLGAEDLTYTQKHGQADIKHATELQEGLVDEMGEAFALSREIGLTTTVAIDKTVQFLTTILIPKPVIQDSPSLKFPKL